MIIGSGLVANSLKNIDSDNILFFASGVSNSLETRDSEFEREFSLLKNSMADHPHIKLIYFSTLSINDLSKQNSPYVIHKRKIEEFIKTNHEKYLILRIGNIVGKGGNPNTLFNYLKTQIVSQSEFTLHSKARRLLIDIEDIPKFLVSSCSDIENEIINCAFPYYYNLKEIIEAIENEADKKAEYREIDEGDFYQVHFDPVVKGFFSQTQAEQYIKVLTKKYF